MARITFELPAHFGFATEVQVYISHVNQGGHLDNAQLLSLVSEARVRFFRALGWREGEVGGAAIVVADLLAQYRSEAFHGETLRVQMQPLEFNRYGFDLVFHMVEAGTGREVARGKTGIVFIDRATRRATPIPQEVQAQLQRCAAPASTA